MRRSEREVIIKRLYDNKNREVGYEQVAEMVRCRDCAKRDSGCPLQVWCGPEDDDFCSRGVRKE